MIILKISALIASLVLYVYAAEKINTEIGMWGFIGTVASIIWLLVP